MEKRWTCKNIELAWLSEHIGKYLKEKNFEAIKGQTSEGYYIFAENSPHFRLDGHVSVAIEGKPDDFTVKLELCRERKRNLYVPVIFTTLLVGGYFLNRTLRSEEHWVKLQKEFWRRVENIILFSNSSSE